MTPDEMKKELENYKKQNQLVVPDCEKELLRLKADMASVKTITDGWEV